MSDLDLTDQQIEITRRTYFDRAQEYVKFHERRPGALEKAQLDTLDPFLNRFKQSGLSGSILFAGCGSGRDMEYANNQGLSTQGIDISPAMLEIAKNYVNGSPLAQMDITELAFPNEHFDGIFCETALSHIKKSELPIALNSFYKTLSSNGLVLFGFRQGDGHVYAVRDAFGLERYNTTLTIEEAEALITDSKFQILNINIAVHALPNRPNFIDIIAKK
jgi:SAM-dependent methyltransferase